MDYSVVKRAHIVPRCLLAAFAANGRLKLNIDGRLLPGTLPVENVATRRSFYRRTRPDGTSIDDGEWSLSQIESAAAPILADLSSRWDGLTLRSKATLAEFFAIQMVRGPRWKEWWESHTRKSMESLRHNPEPILKDGLWIPITQSAVNQLEDHVLQDTEWLRRMLGISKKITAILGSMRWTLLEFENPCLALSDHPVISWPLNAAFRRPEPNHSGVGALNLLEVRIPISPRQAILMTWSDEPGLTQRAQASKEIASNLNAFTIANAERQWFHRPGEATPVASGFLDPISPATLDGYDRLTAEASRIRKEVSKSIEPLLGDDSSDFINIITSRFKVASRDTHDAP
jgi:hypothetical protein